MFHRVALPLLAVAFASRLSAAEPQVEPAQLPRVPATPPEQALGTFKIKPGFRIELVAAEPLVVDPIALSFDEDGRCYVVEMRDYSERRPERLGRIRLLEDTDGDGRFDKSTVFAQDLPWPTAVICWDGGVFVGATPDIIYFKDTNGDGVTDVREVVFSGFAADYAPFATNKLNVQALMNSFNWSLDNRIHGATSFSGGKVRLVDSPFVREWIRKAANGSPHLGGEGEQKGARNPKPETRNEVLDLRGRDFSFDPRTLEMRAESGGGQHGLSFDNRGRKFVCSNSSHVQTLMYEERYAARNPFYSMPRALVDIAVDGGAAEVFRISPDEPWRVIRTQWRVSGLVPGPIEGGGRPSGYFTGATGITIYRGDAFGPDFVGDAFVGDAGGNLVHRKKILADGVGVKAVRPSDEQNVEFLASTDTWFRPVQFANAPDGCLYICDMYREVIEHPWSLPDSIKKHLDLNSGNDRGRIYRIVPEKFKQPKMPRLSRVSGNTLSALLAHPNGWYRNTAARLIYERQGGNAIPGLEAQALSRTEPRLDPRRGSLAIMHSLHALAGLGALTEEHVLAGLKSDLDAAVRENALKLAEPFLAKPSASLLNVVSNLARAPRIENSTSRDDLQLAFTLGSLSGSDKCNLLLEFIGNRNFIIRDPKLRGRLPDSDLPWLMDAALSSLGNQATNAVRLICRFPPPSPLILSARGEILSRLASQMGSRNKSNEVAEFVGAVSTLDSQGIWQCLTALEVGLKQRGSSLQQYQVREKLKRQIDAALRQPLPYSKLWDYESRLATIRLIGLAGYDQARTNLLELISSSKAWEGFRAAAIDSLAYSGHPDVAKDILDLWPVLTTALHADALKWILKRPEWIHVLLAAMESNVVQTGDLTIAQQSFLRSHRDAAIRTQAVKVVGGVDTATRQSVVERFQPAPGSKGDKANGRKIFQARCATCHKLGSEGHALGPDLATVKNAGKEKLLTNILDPNREVAPQFSSYLVETKDGESLAGLIVNENANSVTFRMAGGAETVVARANIASMQSQGKSLMPEGLEEGLNQQDMADLLEFIVATP